MGLYVGVCFLTTSKTKCSFFCIMQNHLRKRNRNIVLVKLIHNGKPYLTEDAFNAETVFTPEDQLKIK